MIADFPTSPRDSENTARYNPKIVERKMNPQTEWAELVRQQQYYAEKMIQQEKDKKAQQKAELNEVLSSLVQEKETKKKFFTANEKQEDFAHSMARKQEYDQYLNKVKNDKLENQKAFANEYSRHMWQKEEENKKKIFQDKQAEERMIADALDSLQREKIMKDKMRSDFINSVDSLMQEKEAQRRREQEKREQDREEYRRLMDERARNLQLQEENYKLYYQRINEKQNNRQQMWDQTIGQTARYKDRSVDGFIEKGIEEARRKAELEELERQRKKQEQLRNVRESLQAKINEQEQARLKEKLSYQEKVEELMRQNQQAYQFKEQVKKEKINHTMDYKSVLESQMREAEEQKRKFNLGMLEQEKKLHNHFDGLIPGIRSSKVDNQLSVQTRSARNLGSDLTSPYSGASPLLSPYTNKSDKLDSIKTPTSSYNPFNTDRSDHYNPITNPIPNTVQNPYLAKDFQRGGIQSKNNLSSYASKNLIG